MLWIDLLPPQSTSIPQKNPKPGAAQDADFLF